jgi:DNA polymerase-1
MNNSTKELLVVLDAHALIHRSFHAIPALNAPDGRPVNAVFGFASTTLTVLDTLKPKYLAVAFDEPGPTFRDELFADYKATRVATVDELKAQFPMVRELVAALGIPLFAMAGYEADDLIGTLAKQAEAAATDTVIVSGDHDLYQLITDHVSVYNVSRGLKAAELLDELVFRGRYGFAPNLLPDYKALRGDTSDNIPGVAGIGPKTAKQLIADLGGLDTILAACEPDSAVTMKSAVKDKICAHKDQAILSKILATIVTDAPITLNLKDCIVHEYDETKARALFESLGFKSLLKRLPKSMPSSAQGSLF